MTFTELRHRGKKPNPAEIAAAFAEEIEFLVREFDMVSPLHIGFSAQRVAADMALQVAADLTKGDETAMLMALLALRMSERVAVYGGKTACENMRDCAYALDVVADRVVSSARKWANKYEGEAA